MTRINVGILPKELPDKLLLAELREIKRIPNMINSGKAKIENIPDTFRLGTGHVKFFYDKGKYTLNRYMSLFNESQARNFKTTDFTLAWNNYPSELMNDYNETLADRNIIIERITERGFELLK